MGLPASHIPPSMFLGGPDLLVAQIDGELYETPNHRNRTLEEKNTPTLHQ